MDKNFTETRVICVPKGKFKEFFETLSAGQPQRQDWEHRKRSDSSTAWEMPAQSLLRELWLFTSVRWDS